MHGMKSRKTLHTLHIYIWVNITTIPSERNGTIKGLMKEVFALHRFLFFAEISTANGRFVFEVVKYFPLKNLIKRSV